MLSAVYFLVFLFGFILFTVPSKSCKFYGLVCIAGAFAGHYYETWWILPGLFIFGWVLRLAGKDPGYNQTIE